MPGLDFDAEFTRCVPSLAAWATLKLRGPLQAELSADDLVQEVACRAFARRDRFDPEAGPFRAWLFGIARNVLLRALEDVATRGRLKRDDWLSTQGLQRLPDDVTSVTQVALRGERTALLLRAVEDLDDADRRLLVARGLEGLPHADVAALLGVEPAAASKRWDRLRARLQEDWNGLDLAV